MTKRGLGRDAKLNEEGSMRKPVAALQPELGELTVICNDGSVWRLIESYERQWQEVLPPIPGTPAADQSQSQ